MATYNRSQFKLGDVADMAAGLTGLSGLGFSIINQHGSPLLSIVYTTEGEAKSAHKIITAALANAIAVSA